MEAMVCGRTAVLTDVGGNLEWITEGKNGFVADAPTLRSFGAALERAWDARENWSELGMRARETALAQIDDAPGETLLQVVLHSTARAKV
jgi:glycosyltransferase involved in cell wall biosynthesis